MSDFTVVDEEKTEIKVGTRVLVLGYPSASGGVPDALAVVDRITEPDGDVDDEGRGIAIHPKVNVIFDEDGEADEFNTHWLGKWWNEDAPFMCDDVRVVEP